MAVKLYPHQEKAVNQLHNGSILWGDVGTGKTLTALAYYVKNYTGYGEDLDIYVITTAKKRDSLDWERDAARYGIGKIPDASTKGVLTVDSWNNIGKYVDVERGFFIFDEQRLVGSGAWTKAFTKIAAKNEWILLTATPGDTWLDYIPVFIANGFYKNRTAFLREHVIYNTYSKFPKVDRYVGVNKLVRHRNSLLVHMQYLRHTTRVTEQIEVDYDHGLFERVWKKRWHVYENRPLKGIAELFLVMRKVVNSDPGRLRSLEILIANHPRLIVFYNFNYELEALRSIFEKNSTSDSNGECGPNNLTQESESWTPSESTSGWNGADGSGSSIGIPRKLSAPTPSPSNLSRRDDKWQTQKLVGTTSSKKTKSTTSSSVSAAQKSTRPDISSQKDTSGIQRTISGVHVAEWNGHKHEPVPTSDRWVYLVQYQAGAEGWNCTATDAMVFYSLTYSYKLWHQAHGRIDRLNTTFSTLYYYVLKSNSLIDKIIWKSLSEKKSFNEAEFIRKTATISSI
jgi:hypothetical protein